MNDDAGAGKARRKAWWRPCLLAPVAGVVLMATACGGGSHPAGSAATTEPGAIQQVNRYAQCMRGHGVPNFYVTRQASSTSSNTAGPVLKLGPNEIVQGVDTASPQYQSAQKTCGHLLPAAAPAVLSAGLLKGFIKAAACMRAHGYQDWPDPVMRNGHPFTQVPSGIDTSSPRFQSAQKTCSPQM